MQRLKNVKLYLLDMDGTIYLDNDLFDGTIDFLNKVKSKGGRYLFLTNNSSKSTEAYVNKLRKIGINANPEDFLTSTDATILYLNNNYKGKKFYCFGTKSFFEQLEKGGIKVTTEPDEDVFGIVMGNDSELTFKKLDDTCRMLSKRADMVYIATNPDWVCPTSYGYVPDCGCVADMIKRATGREPLFIGKPKPEMILLALQNYGYEKCDAVMVGDRVYTDIASGYNAGIDTVFVLSGEGTVEDATNTETKPTYIMKNIRELCENI